MARCAPCLDHLLAEVNRLAPKRSKASDGWIGDPAHASRRSDHNPDSRGIVHARDFTHDPTHGADMHVLSEMVKFDKRVKYIIWNRRIWNPSVSSSWRAYGGSNPHTKHMHVSCLSGSSIENDVGDWLEQEDDMAQVPQEEWEEVKERVEAIWKDHGDLKSGKYVGVLEDIPGRLGAYLQEMEARLIAAIEAKHG